MQDGYPIVNGWAKEDACNNGKKLLKMYPKYSKKAFDNIVTCDETWCIILNQSRRLPTEYGPLKCKMPKYCQTNTNGKEGFVCNFFNL